MPDAWVLDMSLKAINHLAFITADLTATVRFYRDLLGMPLTLGVGHDGYRHYFLRCGDSHVAFFEYDGARPIARKFPGDRTSEPRGFDHVSFSVATCGELFDFKDRLEAAGVEVHGAVDHGALWSIYFYDPNGIALEISWDCVEVTRVPAIADDMPLAIVAEGSAPRPDAWPAPTRRTPPSEWTAKPGNGIPMRDALVDQGKVRVTDEYARLARA